MPLTQVYGPRGSGKTLFILIICYLFSRRPVISNFKMKIPNRYVPLSLIKLLYLPKHIELVMDEAYSMIDSRISMSYVNVFCTYLAYQLRKTDINIFLTVIQLSSIDVRYREEWDYRVYCERIPNGHENWKLWDFSYTIADFRTKTVSVWTIKYQDVKWFFDLYDTYEIIEPRMKSRITFEILKSDPVQLINRAKEITKEIYSSLISGDKEDIKYCLNVNGHDEIWAGKVNTVLERYKAVKKAKAISN